MMYSIATIKFFYGFIIIFKFINFKIYMNFIKSHKFSRILINLDRMFNIYILTGYEI